MDMGTDKLLREVVRAVPSNMVASSHMWLFTFKF